MFIDQLNDDIESQTGANKAMEWRDIIDAARVKYKNMNSLSQLDTVDLRNVKLLALATQVETLKSSQSSSGKSWKGEGAGNSEKIGGVAKWRTIKDKGESCEWSGTTWYWCSKHKRPNGAFDGLYCTHKPEDHDEWKANRNAWKKDKDKKDGNPTESRTKSLSVSQKLKSVLCTKLMLSDEDAEEICKDCQVN